MDEFIKNMFKPTTKPSIRKTNASDKIINEAIILDTVGSYEKLSEFYNNIGPYGARDGVLSECPEFKPNECGYSEVAAVLAAAKDANDPDFKVYMNAKEVQNIYFEKLVKKFGKIAESKIEQQKQVLDNNARVQDALTQTQEGCCKKD